MRIVRKQVKDMLLLFVLSPCYYFETHVATCRVTNKLVWICMIVDVERNQVVLIDGAFERCTNLPSEIRLKERW